MNTDYDENIKEESSQDEPELNINPIRLEQYLQKLRDNQNLLVGVLGGLIASIIGAGIWTTITILTEFQIGWMAVGIGFLVGFAIRFLGKGVDTIFGIAGGALSLFGCILGNFLTMIFMISQQENIPLMNILANINIDIIVSIMIETFQVMDVLFYGIAVYEGYRFSINTVSEEELQALSHE